MGDILRVEIRDAYQQIKTAEHLFNEGLRTLSTALKTIGTCESILLKNGLENLPLSDQPVTEHRREHRMGPVPKIDSGPELQTFILARIDRMTYAQLAQDAVEHFPEPRRAAKSTIYNWIKRQRRR